MNGRFVVLYLIVISLIVAGCALNPSGEGSFPLSNDSSATGEIVSILYGKDKVLLISSYSCSSLSRSIDSGSIKENVFSYQENGEVEPVLFETTTSQVVSLSVSEICKSGQYLFCEYDEVIRYDQPEILKELPYDGVSDNEMRILRSVQFENVSGKILIDLDSGEVISLDSLAIVGTPKIIEYEDYIILSSKTTSSLKGSVVKIMKKDLNTAIPIVNTANMESADTDFVFGKWICYGKRWIDTENGTWKTDISGSNIENLYKASNEEFQLIHDKIGIRPEEENATSMVFKGNDGLYYKLSVFFIPKDSPYDDCSFFYEYVLSAYYFNEKDFFVARRSCNIFDFTQYVRWGSGWLVSSSELPDTCQITDNKCKWTVEKGKWRGTKSQFNVIIATCDGHYGYIAMINQPDGSMEPVFFSVAENPYSQDEYSLLYTSSNQTLYYMTTDYHIRSWNRFTGESKTSSFTLDGYSFSYPLQEGPVKKLYKEAGLETAYYCINVYDFTNEPVLSNTSFVPLIIYLEDFKF